MTVIYVLITIGFVTMIYVLAYFVYDILEYGIDQHNKKDCEVFDVQKYHIISGNVNGYNYSGMSNMNKQIVYKVDGNFVGDIKGDNVTVILMGDGDFVGDIDSPNGEVVLIRGSIDGDVKANKIICPSPDRTAMQKYIDKLTCVEKLSKNHKYNKEEEEKDCFKCYWFDSEKELCKSWDANEGKCEFVDKDRAIKEAKEMLDWVLPKPTEKNKYVNCADCSYATEHIPK